MQLLNRIRCHPNKIDKLLQKAFRSKEPIKKGDVANPQYYTEYYGYTTIARKMMGYIWLFVRKKYETNSFIFITVYHPVGKKGRSRKEPWGIKRDTPLKVIWDRIYKAK